jgi:hypothetical protein
VVKGPVDNIISATKMNAFIFSVQDIRYHVAKYTKIPGIWRNEYCIFQFTDCIRSVTDKQLPGEFRKSRFHMLIVSVSTAFFCSVFMKMEL